MQAWTECQVLLTCIAIDPAVELELRRLTLLDLSFPVCNTVG